jgi:predicted membrane channel-forming protein YqfA (hemolysin III family)
MTLLNTYTQPGCILALWIVLILVGVSVGTYPSKKDGTVRILRYVCLVCLVVVGILGCIFWAPWETRYECLFDKNLTYTEIAEHWDVKEQRGEIWVVTAKEAIP